jgi:hypothetical protein
LRRTTRKDGFLQAQRRQVGFFAFLCRLELDLPLVVVEIDWSLPAGREQTSQDRR